MLLVAVNDESTYEMTVSHNLHLTNAIGFVSCNITKHKTDKYKKHTAQIISNLLITSCVIERNVTFNGMDDIRGLPVRISDSTIALFNLDALRSSMPAAQLLDKTTQ
jgi:hypothetical protein